MMTSIKYSVSWCYQEGDRTVRRSLHNIRPEPCIEAARIIDGHLDTYDIEVIKCDTGEQIDWAPPGLGRVLIPEVPKS